jgi:glycerophosphoryl diester phosphodiesterase
LAALAKCLEMGVAKVEIDVIPLADGSFALLHDPNLEQSTTGKGNAVGMGRAEVENLHYVVDSIASDEKVGFLEGAVTLLQAHPATLCLQLDLKPFTPLTSGVIDAFLGILDPVRDRVQVTSVADWAIRALAKQQPQLELGFDPLLYLDIVDDEPRPENIPPFRVGAYGLRDDHPLSSFQWGSPRDYFAARAAALLAQVPEGIEWFIRGEVLKVALDSGFDWIDFLHKNGSRVDGWTIDAAQPEQICLAQTLVDQGIDELTSDSPAQLAPYLPAGAVR